MAKSSPPQIQRKKPYAFARVPEAPKARPPIFHDGREAAGLVSGELRCELTNLTPLLVGWERVPISELSPGMREKLGPLNDEAREKKAVLFPLRMPGRDGAVVIPGDSLKGMLRHELGALLGAPMERVAERLYSYRPNAMFPDEEERSFLQPRLARVLACTEMALEGGERFRVPTKVAVYQMATRNQQTYYPRKIKGHRRESVPDGKSYRGGMGAGVRLPDVYPEDEETPETKTSLEIRKCSVEHAGVSIEPATQEQYLRTLQHYLHGQSGHFSRRHPRIQSAARVADLGRAMREAARRAFAKEDHIWVEWDLENKRVVSFGWHYYYRWAYRDSVRTRGPKGDPRACLSPTEEEKARQEGERAGAPARLTGVRRLLGYTDAESGGIGAGNPNYTQLMGRVSINAALEEVRPGEREEDRFSPLTFLKELGMPRPSAVEHYLDQSQVGEHRPRDAAMLVTYGDATGQDGSTGYDRPGELAGRKLYLDRKLAGPQTWEDNSPENRNNPRSTIAVDASRSGRRFRFTLRFRDLEESELTAVMLALCPDQLARHVSPRDSGKEYCSKLGYARPLGWGSIKICTKELHFLEERVSEGGGATPYLRQETNVERWFAEHLPTRGTAEQPALVEEALLDQWLGLHVRGHELAGDYPSLKATPDDERKKKTAKGVVDKDQPQIYTYHTELRAWHSRLRRYRRQGR